jgi:hypothetical protein
MTVPKIKGLYQGFENPEIKSLRLFLRGPVSLDG